MIHIFIHENLEVCHLNFRQLAYQKHDKMLNSTYTDPSKNRLTLKEVESNIVEGV